MSNPPSNPDSRSSTPSRFTSTNATAEDLLSTRTVGLVNLSDYRKRRAEVFEEKERAASGVDTPASERASTPQPVKKKKKKNVAGKGKLSFGLDDEEDGDSTPSTAAATPRHSTPDSQVRKEKNGAATPTAGDTDGETAPPFKKKKLGPNAGIGPAPKALTKSALLREAQAREQLRKDYLAQQEIVKNTEIAIPFVFYDGTKVPGGVCRIKKGEHVWLFLDKARKVGAELGAGGGGQDKSRREWARVSVDDLMFVRGEIVVPHHYQFYYFIVNKTLGFNGPLFNYSAQPTSTSPTSNPNSEPATPQETAYDPLSRPVQKREKTPGFPDEELAGYHDDPGVTKVVDRRWYERNKHIFPASVWEEFDPSKDYTTGIRKDMEGNSFFF